MNELNLESLIDNMNIPIFNGETKFWLVRSNGGAFFDEFISQNYIALAWNDINQEMVNTFSKEQKEAFLVLLELEGKYSSVSSTRGAWNKCDTFINSIHTGDIIMIPNKRSNKIAIAIAGDYYEVDSLSSSEEIEVLYQLKENWNETFAIKCPYKKRRSIKVVNIIEGDSINPNLYKALISYHGISNIDSYAEFILNTMYPVYIFNNKINIVFNVQQKNPIGAIDLAGFIYNSASILKSGENQVTVTTKSNINSPGELILSLVPIADNLLDSG